MKENIVIIGNGISGVTTARHIRKRSDHEITIISSETDYFFSRTALMYVYMGHMKFEHTKPYEDKFWKKNRINLRKEYVKDIDFGNKSLIFSSGDTMDYDKLVIATGSVPQKFDWPGQNLRGVQGLYSYQDLLAMEDNTKGIRSAVIVGGGLIGVEMAEMLLSRGISVNYLVRENHFWGNVLPSKEGNLISRHIKEHGVELHLGVELKEILSGENGRVRAVADSEGKEISCDFVGLTVGVRPNIDFLKSTELETERGILVDEYLRTSIDDVYALGDCAQHRNPPAGRTAVEQVWYTGRMMGEVLASTLTGELKAYKPGPWFNSAKFFDIEYQTYGRVGNSLGENESEFYWEHESGNKCVHFIWDSQSGSFLGINSFGIRWRHEVFDRWLREETEITEVIENLELARFEPEFFPRHEPEIRNQYKGEVQV